MSLMKRLFGEKKPNTADVAKNRLSLLIAHERAAGAQPDFLPALQKELLAVISKYISIDLDDIAVNIERQGDCEVLELNVTLPDKDGATAKP